MLSTLSKSLPSSRGVTLSRNSALLRSGRNRKGSERWTGHGAEKICRILARILSMLCMVDPLVAGHELCCLAQYNSLSCFLSPLIMSPEVAREIGFARRLAVWETSDGQKPWASCSPQPCAAAAPRSTQHREVSTDSPYQTR